MYFYELTKIQQEEIHHDKIDKQLSLYEDEGFDESDMVKDYKSFDIYQRHKVILSLQHLQKKHDFDE
jgi:hypothetical protein